MNHTDPKAEAVDCIVCGAPCEHDLCDEHAELADLILDAWEAAAAETPAQPERAA